MKQPFLLICAFVASALMLVSCNKDDHSGTDPGNGGVVSGIPTFAQFTFKLDKETTTKANAATKTPDQDGTAEEQAVKNIYVYVFNDKGTFEASSKGSVIENTDGVAHSEVMKLTSGLKTILVVGNMKPEWFVQPNSSTTLTAFQNMLIDLFTTPGRIAHGADVPAVNRVGDGDILHGAGDAASGGFLMSNTLSQTSFTLNAGVSQTQAEQNDYATPEEAAKYNHFTIVLHRATSKLQTTYPASSALDHMAVLGDLGNTIKIGKLTSPTFTVRNMPKSVYLFKHNATGGFALQTPFYSATNTGSVWADFASRYDEANIPNIPVANLGEGQSARTIYVPENANEVPVVGNTSYVLVKGTYVPNNEYIITGVTDAGDYEYGFRGQSDAPVQFTNAPDWGVAIYAVPPHIVGDAERKAYGIKYTLRSYLVRLGLTKYIPATEAAPVYDNNNDEDVYYSAEWPDVKVGIYHIIEIFKHTRPGSGGNDPFTKTKVETIRFLLYTNGECYYRVNIQDKTYAENNNLFYSLTRNNFYQVSITSISGIGYPNESDVTIDPETPISQKTHMQAHISVEKWTVVEQNTDLNQ